MSVETEEAVPKLPRGRGLRFSKPEMFRIALTLITLIGVIMMTGPCSNAVSSFVMGFEGSGSAGSAGSAANQLAPEQQYEQLRPGMTDAELKAAIERSKARQSGSAAGSAAPATAP